MENSLFVITLWDEDPYSYAIAAEDLIKAKQIAIQQHLKEYEEANPEVDETLCYEITVALGVHGSLYNVLIS